MSEGCIHMNKASTSYLLGGVEARVRLEAAMDHKGVVEHEKVKAHHIGFADLADAVEPVCGEQRETVDGEERALPQNAHCLKRSSYSGHFCGCAA